MVCDDEKASKSSGVRVWVSCEPLGKEERASRLAVVGSPVLPGDSARDEETSILTGDGVRLLSRIRVCED